MGIPIVVWMGSATESLSNKDQRTYIDGEIE
jgi:hypothetical protein